MPETATYVYCIVAAPRRPTRARVPDGVPGAGRPELREIAKSSWLVMASVPLSVYGPGPLERRLKDLDWVARVALAHEALVEHFGGIRGATVVPLKLFTMFSDPARAVRGVQELSPVWKASLRRVRNCQEWGVRIMLKPDAVRPRRVQPAPRSGTDFLVAKKEARDASHSRALQAAAAAGDAFTQLARAAREAVHRPAPEGAERPPLLDAAFLVPVSRKSAFHATVRRAAAACRAAGANLVLTGPWPAYSFVRSSEAAS